MSNKYGYDYEEREYKVPKLKTDRNIWKFIILNIVTLGIYSIVFFMPFSFDLDKVAPKRDGSRTMNYIFAYLLSMFTFFIVLYIWQYQISCRIEEALNERNINYEFGTDTFWKWYLLGSLILVGPYVYLYRLCKAMNLLCENYNNKSGSR